VRSFEIKNANEAVHRYLSNYLGQRVVEDLAPNFLTEVRKPIDAVMDDPEMTHETVARSLGMSKRTFQRKLEAEATTFRKVLDEERSHRAMHLMNTSSLATYEIAFLLSYSEPSALQRAFKRWTKQTPGQYRQSSAGATRK